MTIYTAKRQSGKTTMLIKQSAETGDIIVAPNYQMVNHIEELARNIGETIPTPITVFDYIQRLARRDFNRNQDYLIDQLQMVVYQMNVEIATVDKKHVYDLLRLE